MSRLADLPTPALLLDAARLDANLARMAARAQALGVRLRPHMKTMKSLDVARRALRGPDRPVTVSTLREAQAFLEGGFPDILYAVGVSPDKIAHAARLNRAGAALTLVLDSVGAARALAEGAAREGVTLPVMIEIDSDGHRAGVTPDAPELTTIAAALDPRRTPLKGVMTHAGESYACRSWPAFEAMAEQERAAAVAAAECLRSAGFPSPEVSVGSTPTALAARHLDGVTELRAGVYMSFDLVMAGLGVCTVDDIALSVLTTVIGRQPAKGWVLVDAGWMALSRDRGTSAQPVDQGYGLVADEAGALLPGLWVAAANQEHGIVARRNGGSLDPSMFPVGRRLRIVPNHACSTGAQHPHYHVLRDGGGEGAVWPRFGGW